MGYCGGQQGTLTGAPPSSLGHCLAAWLSVCVFVYVCVHIHK